MLKSLFATCLTAFSVNTQPLAPSRPLEPSRAITSETTFNVGDYVTLSVICNRGESSSVELFLHSDTRINSLKVIDYYISNSYSFFNYGGYPLFDFCVFNSTFDFDNFHNDFNFFTLDNDTDDECIFNLLFDDSINSFSYSFTFEILEGFEGFSSEAFPYLTKVEKPYTPPAKSNLYRLLYDFYYSIFSDDDLATISTGYNMPFDNWLAHTCTIATLITLIVVAFFFLRWLFKVISGLILLKR